MKIVSPVIIKDDTCALSCYITPEHAAASMESIDVTWGDPPYQAYDSEGRLLEVQTLDEKGNVSPSSHNVNNRFVKIISTEQQPTHTAKVRKLIQEDLEYNCDMPNLENKSLSELVSLLFKDRAGNKKIYNIVLPILIIEDKNKINVFYSLYKCIKFLRPDKVLENLYEGCDGFGRWLKFDIMTKAEYLDIISKEEKNVIKKIFNFFATIGLPEKLVNISNEIVVSPSNTDLKNLLKERIKKEEWESNDLATLINYYAWLHK